MTETELPEDDRALAAEYVLGLMSMDEAADFRGRMSREPALAALVLSWQEDFATLADEVEAIPPPAKVWRKLDRRLFNAHRASGWLIAGIPSILAAALAVMLVFFPVAQGVKPPANPLFHADLAGENGDLVLAAGYDGDSGELYVIPYSAPEGDRVHELWLIAGGNAPVSMGVLPADAPARLPVSQDLARQLAGGTLAISVEPPGGSPTGAPTGPVIATGEVATL